MKRAGLLLLSVSILVALGSAESEALAGPLTEEAKSLLTGSERSPCDDQVEPLRQEIARELDAREAEIDAFLAKNAGSSRHETLQPGPTPITKPKEGWQTSASFGWSDLRKLYQAAKNKPVGKEWVALNSNYRAALFDDVDRIVSAKNLQLTKDSGPFLRALLGELKACTSEEGCTEPHLSDGSLAYVKSIELYRRRWDYYTQAAVSVDKKKAGFKSLEAWVRGDLDRLEFLKNPLVRKIAPGHFVLPLDLGPFAPLAEWVTRYFHEYWQGEGKIVTIEPRAAGSSPDLYRVSLGTDPGGRAYVDREKKEVRISPDSTTKSVAHELGHVLGFRDNYYTIWNPRDCGWTDQYREDDIMSRTSTGKVLDIHWQKLEEIYQ
jgi:hypothetical protein